MASKKKERQLSSRVWMLVHILGDVPTYRLCRMYELDMKYDQEVKVDLRGHGVRTCG